MKSKKNVTHVEKGFVRIKMKKRNLKYTKKLETNLFSNVDDYYKPILVKR